jgi:hypothetical protein
MGKQLYDYAVIDSQIRKYIASGTSMNYTAILIGCSPDTVRNRVIAMGIELPENRGMIRHSERGYKPPREYCLQFHSLLMTLIESSNMASKKTVVSKIFKNINKGKLRLKKVALV